MGKRLSSLIQAFNRTEQEVAAVVADDADAAPQDEKKLEQEIENMPGGDIFVDHDDKDVDHTDKQNDLIPEEESNTRRESFVEEIKLLSAAFKKLAKYVLETSDPDALMIYKTIKRLLNDMKMKDQTAAVDLEQDRYAHDSQKRYGGKKTAAIDMTGVDVDVHDKVEWEGKELEVIDVMDSGNLMLSVDDKLISVHPQETKKIGSIRHKAQLVLSKQVIAAIKRFAYDLGDTSDISKKVEEFNASVKTGAGNIPEGSFDMSNEELDKLAQHYLGKDYSEVTDMNELENLEAEIPNFFKQFPRTAAVKTAMKVGDTISVNAEGKDWEAELIKKTGKDTFIASIPEINHEFEVEVDKKGGWTLTGSLKKEAIKKGDQYYDDMEKVTFTVKEVERSGDYIGYIFERSDGDSDLYLSKSELQEHLNGGTFHKASLKKQAEFQVTINYPDGKTLDFGTFPTLQEAKKVADEAVDGIDAWPTITDSSGNEVTGSIKTADGEFKVGDKFFTEDERYNGPTTLTISSIDERRKTVDVVGMYDPNARQLSFSKMEDLLDHNVFVKQASLKKKASGIGEPYTEEDVYNLHRDELAEVLEENETEVPDFEQDGAIEQMRQTILRNSFIKKWASLKKKASFSSAVISTVIRNWKEIRRDEGFTPSEIKAVGVDINEVHDLFSANQFEREGENEINDRAIDIYNSNGGQWDDARGLALDEDIYEEAIGQALKEIMQEINNKLNSTRTGSLKIEAEAKFKVDDMVQHDDGRFGKIVGLPTVGAMEPFEAQIEWEGDPDTEFNVDLDLLTKVIMRGGVRRTANDKLMRHVDFDDIALGIEWPKDTIRQYSDGYHQSMKCDYGFVRNSLGDDGEDLDVYIGDPKILKVFQIDQLKPETGDHDENKYMVGFSDIKSAISMFLQHMPLEFFGGAQEIPIDTFRQIARTGQEDISSINMGV